MKFSIRDLIFVTVIVALAVALVYVKWPSGRGRYQMTPGAHERLFIMDTATGKIWRQIALDEKWVEYKSPDYDK